MHEGEGKNMARSEEEVKWSTPIEGTYKLNTDVAVMRGKGIGMGGVVRDFEGDLLMATCCGVMNVENVELAEALSVRHGIKIALEAGLNNLIVEMDCKKLFSHLHAGRSDVTPFGRVVNDILAFATLCSHVTFSHVKRQGNKVVHLLAQMSKSVMKLKAWLEEVPLEVCSAVMMDRPSS